MTFSDWGYSPTADGGAVAVPASAVAVIPCPDTNAFCGSLPKGEIGFVFTGPWGVASGQSEDSLIGYTITSPAKVIDALLLYGGFGRTGTGFASVGESLSSGGSLFVSDPPGSPSWTTVTFAPLSSLSVMKNIQVDAGMDGTAAISEVTNGWSLYSGVGTRSVPEPGTLALFGAGLLLKLAVRRRRPPVR